MKQTILLIALTYIPLVVLTLWQNLALPDPNNHSIAFLCDATEATRFLVIGPMLLAAIPIIDPWLKQVVTYIKQRLIRPAQQERFDSMVARAETLRSCMPIQLTLLVSTFVWQSIDATFGNWPSAHTWQEIPGSNEHSYAWFWYAYISKPLIRFLWLRWIWRYLVWIWFVVGVSRLDLRLSPAHPDRTGGLGFILVGHGKYAILAFALGVQASSILANQIIYAGKSLWSFRYEILGVVALSLLFFLVPFLILSPKLLEAGQPF